MESLKNEAEALRKEKKRSQVSFYDLINYFKGWNCTEHCVLSGIWLTPLSPSPGNLVCFLEVCFCQGSSSGLSTLALLTPADRG